MHGRKNCTLVGFRTLPDTHLVGGTIYCACIVQYIHTYIHTYTGVCALSLGGSGWVNERKQEQQLDQAKRRRR